MTERLAATKSFAIKSGAAVDSLKMIAGDASNRKYYRLLLNDQSVVLMDAPPEKGEDVRPFVKISNFLSNAGFSAPEILAHDDDAGFLILEDLGDDLFANLLAVNGADERLLYEAAVDLLLDLHRNMPPKLDVYDSNAMAKLAGLSVEWYRAGVTDMPDIALQRGLESKLRERLEPYDSQCTVLIQRDYHAENLLWLPNRKGTKRVGLLDFQDAMLGHPAYDLVSVLQDARRDVPRQIASDMRQRFAVGSGADPADFETAYHVLGLQRNLRILGVFARLSIRDKKPSYIDLIPRVWGHIETNLVALRDDKLTDFIHTVLPKPNAQRLAQLKDPAQ